MPNGIEERTPLERIADRLERLDDRLAEFFDIVETRLASLDSRPSGILRLGGGIVYIGDDGCYHVAVDLDPRKREPDGEQSEPRRRKVKPRLDPERVE
jgi:hypothetical protein